MAAPPTPPPRWGGVRGAAQAAVVAKVCADGVGCLGKWKVGGFAAVAAVHSLFVNPGKKKRREEV